MPRIKIDEVEPDKKVEGRDPRFLTEPTTDEDLRAKSGSPVLAAFCYLPKQVHFAGQHNDEEIILLLRAHLITNVPWILAAIGLALLPVIVVPFVLALGVFPQVTFGLGLSGTLLWYLGVFTYNFLNILYWYFNVGLITNERIVDVDWNSLVYRDVAVAEMTQVEDVREAQIGVLSGIFDYGSVYVQTAGTQQNIEFLNVPHPQLVVREIEELRQVEEKETEINN